jgi:hypothetical protein
MAHMNSSTIRAIQLEVRPLQAKCLAPSESRAQQYEIKRLIPVAANPVQQGNAPLAG